MPELSKVVSSTDFGDWFSLNDTIMGRSSKAVYRSSSKGLSLEDVVVEKKGVLLVVNLQYFHLF